MFSANKVVCVPLIPIRHIIQFPNTDSGVYVAACKQEAFPVPRGAATHIKKTALSSLRYVYKSLSPFKVLVFVCVVCDVCVVCKDML